MDIVDIVVVVNYRVEWLAYTVVIVMLKCMWERVGPLLIKAVLVYPRYDLITAGPEGFPTAE